MELFDIEIPEAGTEEAEDIRRITDAGAGVPRFGGEADPDLEGGEKSCRLGGADPSDPEEFGRGTRREPTPASPHRLKEAGADLRGAPLGSARL
jgi:hypothetical protein